MDPCYHPELLPQTAWIQAPHRVFKHPTVYSFFLLVFTTISMINALCSHSIFQSTDFSIFLTIYQPSLSFTSSSDYNCHCFNNTLSIYLKFFIHLSLVLSLKQNINLGKKYFLSLFYFFFCRKGKKYKMRVCMDKWWFLYTDWRKIFFRSVKEI